MLSKLAFDLAANGRRVRIIASRQLYDAPGHRLPPFEVVGGVEIHRTWSSRFGRHNLLGRAFDCLTFWATAGVKIWHLARPGDLVVAKTDPPMLSVLAGPIARWRGARAINWLQDVYPETAEALGVGAGLVWRPLFAGMRLLRDRSLRTSVMNVVLGARMDEFLVARGVRADRIRLISNFADGTVIRSSPPSSSNALRSDWNLGNAFVVGYSGNLGRAHEYATMLDAITRIERAPATRTRPITFLFVGGGALFESLKRDVAARRLTSVYFQPFQPPERLSESLAAADVHIVSLKPKLEGLIVPSKFYGIAAARRPTLFIGDTDGEIARLVARHACGHTIPVGDGAGLAQIIEDLAAAPSKCRAMGDRARQAFEAEFSKDVAVARWEALLAEVTADPARQPDRQGAATPAPSDSARNAL